MVSLLVRERIYFQTFSFSIFEHLSDACSLILSRSFISSMFLFYDILPHCLLRKKKVMVIAKHFAVLDVNLCVVM